jgi:CelD/BcsL family acetyltransferase involved in cellulose biosynthesis
MYAPAVTGPTVIAEPDCPEAAPAARGAGSVPSERRLRVEQRPVPTIDPGVWDALVRSNPWATPFSAYPFQRAWWEAYGANALDVTLLVREDGDPGTGEGRVVAILPLMCRTSVEAGGAGSDYPQRPGHPADSADAPGSAGTLYMGASYHADYATVLAAPADLRAACRAIAQHLAGRPADPGTGPALDWVAIDLRRLRCADPAADELAAALGALEMELGWTLNLEHEDVCPVVSLPAAVDFEGFLASLHGKDRHEIRRKIRRAEAVGDVTFQVAADPLADLDAFIDLHQARWGDKGLFPPTPGGDQSRRFLRRLFELAGPDGDVRLAFLAVDGRRIAAGMHLETPDAILYYNAGIDPGALDLSPGILLIASYVRLAIATGRRRLDFLRGAEPYKYQWGAVDEPVRRLLVRRTASPA